MTNNLRKAKIYIKLKHFKPKETNYFFFVKLFNFAKVLNFRKDSLDPSDNTIIYAIYMPKFYMTFRKKLFSVKINLFFLKLAIFGNYVEVYYNLLWREGLHILFANIRSGQGSFPDG